MAGQTGQPFHLTHTMSFSCITAAVKCQIGSHIKRASEATYTDTMYILLMVYCKPTFIWKTLFRDEPEINWFVATNFYSVVITTILPKFVCSEDYLRWWGFCKPHDNFLHANKTWFTYSLTEETSRVNVLDWNHIPMKIICWHSILSRSDLWPLWLPCLEGVRTSGRSSSSESLP